MKKTLIKIEFSWANAIIFAFFLCYGYFGAVTFSLSDQTFSLYSVYEILIQLVIIIVPITLFYKISSLDPKKYRDSVVIYKEDALVFLLFFLFLLVTLYDKLNYSLYSDEISYAGSSHSQSMYILFILAKYFSITDKVNFQYLVQFVSLSLLFGLVFFYLVSIRLKWSYRVIFLVLVLAMARFVFILKGGNGSPHPPLNLIPSFIFGSIFGVRDIVFKVSHLFMYATFITIFYRLSIRVISKELTIALSICVSTIPLALEISSMVDHSIWSYYVFVIIMMEIVTSSSVNYLRLISIVSIGSLMRQPIIIATIPIIILMIKQGIINYRFEGFSKNLVIASPLLLFLPFLFRSAFFGTPVVESFSNTNFELLLGHAIEVIQSGIIFTTAYEYFPIWWIATLPLAFLIPYNKRKELIISFFLFFLIILLVYSSVASWVLQKYHIELTATFAVIGIVNLVLYIPQSRVNKTILLIVLLAMSVMNVVNFKKEKEFKLESSAIIPLDYIDAYEYINSKGLSSSTYSIGNTYGVFPEIMNGYSISEVISSRNIYLDQKNIEPISTNEKIDSITKNMNIHAVLIGHAPDKGKTIDGLTSNGWIISNIFKNGRDDTNVVVVLERGKLK